MFSREVPWTFYCKMGKQFLPQHLLKSYKKIPSWALFDPLNLRWKFSASRISELWRQNLHRILGEKSTRILQKRVQNASFASDYEKCSRGSLRRAGSKPAGAVSPFRILPHEPRKKTLIPYIYNVSNKDHFPKFSEKRYTYNFFRLRDKLERNYFSIRLLVQRVLLEHSDE